MISPAILLEAIKLLLAASSLLWVCGQRVCVVQAKRHIHSPRRGLDFVHAGAPHRHRHLVVHRLVRAPKIVKGDPGTDAGPRLAAIGVGFQMHFFVLNRAPQPFDENVVHEAAASVHRNLDAGRHKLAGESLGGERGALIGIENPRLSEPKQRLLKRRRAEARIVGVRQPPCQNRPAGPVDDRHQIEEAARHRDVGHVGRPHVVRLDNLQAAQQVGVYLVPGRGFARARARNQRLDPYHRIRSYGGNWVTV